MNHYDLPGYLVIGDRWSFAVTIKQDGAAISLSGATIKAAIGTGPGAEPLLEKSSPHADIVIDPDQSGAGKGKVTITFLPAETSGFSIPSSGRLFYEVKLVPSGGATYLSSVADGSFRVRPTLID